ncbi:DNA replication regulator sld2 like [Melia azedarach]|uniref:DNA replication regulator sld2 like n=1 Tax=Melia azedarach TaxID=155640 RepID=A0ACC1YSA1_MELAZ|nr:DNA replication regulator sld2 like [Melia azedarach]
MVQKLEAIKGGGGSIKIGTTGTISSLMTRELESVKSAPQTPRTPPVSVACGATSVKRLQPRKSSDEASTSSSNNNINRRSPEIARKTKSYNKSTYQIPMLGSDNVVLDRTPIRQKSDKKGPNIVEIVDIKCGHPERAWANPITNKLKKLGFSKLSESII